ncbi:hypothetical protein LPJ66_007825 [Kickxella alabastrina]|uniref:Uncharacterized protein n=1 Tax=Kickxella alabastrina TaxID=61397 RepID=A0ACC1IG37_9FUNG|nr:hypothetical protein LPJ66_007825 [Kickxella alabastrina]
MQSSETGNKFIGSIQALQQQPDTSIARQLLYRLSAQVRPLMQARNWHVHCLKEFLPTNPSLLGLNINRGQEIRIRLRPQSHRDQFLEYEELLGTLLHELVHIVHGPHDNMFYRLLDELKTEMELLMAKGYTGDGFWSKGEKVGGKILSRAEARERAAVAAEMRIKRGGRGPRVLGGRTFGGEVGLTPAQMAGRAAERRLHDDRCCGVVGDMPLSLSVMLSPVPGDDNEVIVILDSESDQEPASPFSSATSVIEIE